MRIDQTLNLAHAALLIAALVVSAAWRGNAQNIHRVKAQIVIGPSVQVSKAFAYLPHYENLAAGDPNHIGGLITCSMVIPKEAVKLFFQHCYVSFDGGKNWDPTLKVDEGWSNGDPTVVYGRGDNVYFVSLATKFLDKPKDADPDAPRYERKTVVYKSTDRGRTWKELSRFQFIDREYIYIDKTNGKYADRLYIVGQGSVRGISGSTSHWSLQLFRSLDDGKTFLGPVHAEYPDGTIIAGVGTGAVLSDGTFLVMFGLTKLGRRQSLEQEPLLGPNAELHVISSTDGGETFTKSQKITDWKVDRKRGGILGQLAVDPGSKPFKDRLYTVFPAIVSDRIQIQLSSSSDKGKTWSKPVTVNDDRSPEQGGRGPDHLLPAVAVNKDGVVLVTWYDRREAKDNLGWKLRAAASLDGGDTFSASVPVTDAANAYSQTTAWDLISLGTSDNKTSLVSVRVEIDPFFNTGGDTSGLAVDADGTFHPTWIDNRTGIAQLWTAPVRVSGTVVNHGAADLADLEDISKSVTLELSRPTFDRATGTLSMAAQLKNTSKDTVEGPVKVRVLTLESEIGAPEITNADNGQNGTGAIWDFKSQLSRGQLPSMALSAVKTLTFRISDLRPLGQGRDFKSKLLNLDARIFGKLCKENIDKKKEDRQINLRGERERGQGLVNSR
ncbi:MAG TPA: sialidase family protein [Pyrinomonadaceae bacterium]|nr:sialidase family protein [Pyrinomonadaceae bacterium]